MNSEGEAPVCLLYELGSHLSKNAASNIVNASASAGLGICLLQREVFNVKQFVSFFKLSLFQFLKCFKCRLVKKFASLKQK